MAILSCNCESAMTAEIDRMRYVRSSVKDLNMNIDEA